MTEQPREAINDRGWHLAVCERHGDNDPAGDGCNPNCPRRLHGEIEGLREVLRLVTGHFTGPDPAHDFGEIWTEGPTIILTSKQSEVVERAMRSAPENGSEGPRP